MAYTAPGLLTSDGIHLSQRGKGAFCSGACGSHWQGFKVDVKGSGNISGLTVTNYGVIHNGWRDGVPVRVLSLLPRGVLHHSQSLAKMRWESLR